MTTGRRYRRRNGDTAIQKRRISVFDLIVYSVLKLHIRNDNKVQILADIDKSQLKRQPCSVLSGDGSESQHLKRTHLPAPIAYANSPELRSSPAFSFVAW